MGAWAGLAFLLLFRGGRCRLGFGHGIRRGIGFGRRDSREHGVEKFFLLCELFFAGRSLLVAVVVVGIARAATHFRCFTLHQGYHQMVGQAPAFDAVIVDFISQTEFPHAREYTSGWGTCVSLINVLSLFNTSERKALRGLTSPFKIQRFLDEEIGYNQEPQGATCYSPRRVLRETVAHCMEGAVFAALALRRLGHPALLVDLEAVRDSDHVLAVYRANGRWGAVAKSDYAGLRSREPVYQSIRELAMSYFEHYYNPAGEKTLRAYSGPVNLARFDRTLAWMTTFDEIWEIPKYLCEIRHTGILTKPMERDLARTDPRLFAAGRVGGVCEPLFNWKRAASIQTASHQRPR
jgi:hypothetical protein